MSIATITSKGQVTRPKEVRSRLHLETGEKIDFRGVEDAGTAVMIPLNKRIDDVFGMLSKRKAKKPVGVEEMDRAIGDKLRGEYR